MRIGPRAAANCSTWRTVVATTFNGSRSPNCEAYGFIALRYREHVPVTNPGHCRIYGEGTEKDARMPASPNDASNQPMNPESIPASAIPAEQATEIRRLVHD